MAIIIFGDIEKSEFDSAPLMGKISDGVYSVHPDVENGCDLMEITGVCHLEDASEIKGVPFVEFDSSDLKPGGGISIDIERHEATILSPEDFKALKEI